MTENAIPAAVTAAVAEVGPQPGPLLEVLHAVQRRLGCVPEGAVPLIATALNLTRAEVHGTVTFYHHFRRTPPGRWVVQICRAEACLAMGGDAIAAHAEKYLGVSMEHGAVTSADGRVTLEPVEGRRGPLGVETVRFEVATNAGTAFGPLDTVASGGELARFALAMKAALASREDQRQPKAEDTTAV